MLQMGRRVNREMTASGPYGLAIRRASGLCAGAAGATAFLVLLTWITGRWMLGTLGAGYVPMAPSAAGVVLLLSLSVFLNTHRPGRALSTGLCWFSVVYAAVLCTLFLAFPVLGLEDVFPHWMVPVKAEVRGVPVGVMSPLTAAVSLLCAAALALEIPPLGRSDAARRIACALALLAGLVSGCVLLGYAMGTPMQYGSGTVPMSLFSGITLVMLSAGLVLDSEPGIWPLSSIFFKGPSRWTAKGPVAAFLFLFAAIVAVGSFQLEIQQKSLRRAAKAGLDSVVNLKTQEIAHWRQERLDDATFFAKAAFVARDVQELFTAGADAGKVETEVLNWLTLLKGGSATQVPRFMTPGETPAFRFLRKAAHPIPRLGLWWPMP